MDFAVLRTQHAVGQGGFHSGWLLTDGGAAAYVYDCGAEGGEGPERREEEIEAFADAVREARLPRGENPFAALFVSHFDRDHTNGVPSLIRKAPPRSVFVPYLTPAERLAVLVEDARGGGGGGQHLEFVDLVRDPSGWFGAQDVPIPTYFVHGGGEGPPAEETPPAPSEPPDPSPDARETDSPPALDTTSMRPPAAVPQSRTSPNERHVSHSSPLPVVLRGSRRRLGWALVLHVNDADQRIGDFEREAEGVLQSLGTSVVEVLQDSTRLRHLLQDEASLAALARGYRRAWPGSGQKNHTTMSVYSGPDGAEVGFSAHAFGSASRLWRPTVPWVHRLLYGWPFGPWPSPFLWQPQRAAWLSTGDAPMRNRQFRTGFLKHYASYVDRVSTFVLPHHGSRHSFHGEVLDRLEPGRVVVAAGRRNRFGHPHPQVVLEATERAAAFVHVHEDPGTTILDWCWAATP